MALDPQRLEFCAFVLHHSYNYLTCVRDSSRFPKARATVLLFAPFVFTARKRSKGITHSGMGRARTYVISSPCPKRVCLFQRDWGQCSHHNHDKMANIYRDTRKNTLQINSSRTKNGVPKFYAISGYFIKKSILIWMTIYKPICPGVLWKSRNQ